MGTERQGERERVGRHGLPRSKIKMTMKVIVIDHEILHLIKLKN